MNDILADKVHDKFSCWQCNYPLSFIHLYVSKWQDFCVFADVIGNGVSFLRDDNYISFCLFTGFISDKIMIELCLVGRIRSS